MRKEGAFFRAPIVEANMEKSEKSAYRNNWIAEKLDRVNLTMPKGKKEQVKEIADKLGLSVNAYINLAIDERMEKDASGGVQ